MSSASLPQRIRQRFFKERQCCSGFLIGFCCFSAAILLLIGSIELYKVQTFAVHQCQVKFLNVIQKNDRFYPRWTIQVHDEERITMEYIFGSTGFLSASLAWNKVEKYKVNQTYSCYRSRNHESDLLWTWQWNKPSKFNVFGLFISATVLVYLTMALRLFRRCHPGDDTDIRQQIDLQNQLTALFSDDEEQQQPTAPVESPPPTYEEAMKQIERS